MKYSKFFMIPAVLFAYSALASVPTGQVLVLLPSQSTLSLQDGGKHVTGYFLSEVATPLRALVRLNYELVLATPDGRAPVMDPVSDQAKWFSSPEEYRISKDFMEALMKRPIDSLRRMTRSRLSSMDALFVPGGHAAMEQYPSDQEIGRVLSHFHSNRKPTALICHGPAALLAAKDRMRRFLYSGYQMTVFSTEEEKIEESNGDLGGKVTFYVQDALASLGAKVSVAAPWTSHVVRDRELITAQNPMSDLAIGQALIEALAERKFINLPVNKWSGDPASFRRSGSILDIAQRPVDWTTGYTTIYIGSRKEQIPPEKFAPKLASHVELALETFSPAGLRGYLVFASDDFEIAYQNWSSRENAEKALSALGKPVVSDADMFMDYVLFKPVTDLKTLAAMNRSL